MTDPRAGASDGVSSRRPWTAAMVIVWLLAILGVLALGIWLGLVVDVGLNLALLGAGIGLYLLILRWLAGHHLASLAAVFGSMAVAFAGFGSMATVPAVILLARGRQITATIIAEAPTPYIKGVANGYNYTLRAVNGASLPGHRCITIDESAPRAVNSTLDVIIDPGGLVDPQLPGIGQNVVFTTLLTGVCVAVLAAILSWAARRRPAWRAARAGASQPHPTSTGDTEA